MLVRDYWAFKVRLSLVDPAIEGRQKFPALDRGYNSLSAAKKYAREGSSHSWFATVYDDEGVVVAQYHDKQLWADGQFIPER